MNKLITSVTVNYKNGEKQKLALLEIDKDYVIAPYFNEERWEWYGSGEYLPKRTYGEDATRILDIFVSQVNHESESSFVKSINF